MACSITIHDEPRGAIVVVEGDADLNSADILRGELERALSGRDQVLVDLTGTTLLDSRTIGVLAAAIEKLRDAGRTMPIVSDDANVLRLFATLGLDSEFSFYPSREAAFAA